MFHNKFLATRIILVVFSFFLISCGGGKLTLEEAKKISLHYQGENYTPPPRGVDQLIKEIVSAEEGLVRDHLCPFCDFLDPEDKDIVAKLNALSQLAAVNHMRGNSQKAVDYINRAVKLLDHKDVKELYTPNEHSQFDHDFFLVLFRAGIMSSEIGSYSDAISYIKRAITLNEEKIRPWPGKSLFQHALLAKLYAAIGNVNEAESELSKAESIYSRLQNLPHPRVKKFIIMFQQDILMTNGIIKNSQGELREAEEYFRRAIVEMEDYVEGRKGWTWRNRAFVMGPYLVDNLLSQGRVAEAEAQAIEAIRYTLTKFGFEGFVTAKILQSYIKVLINRERYKDARKIIKLTDHIFEKIGANKNSVEWVKLRMSLADVYVAEGNWLDAKNEYKNIYDELKSEPELRDGLFNENLNWAVVLTFNKNNQEAEKIARSAIAKQTSIFGTNHLYVVEAESVLAMIKAKAGEVAKATEIFEKLMPMFTGENDDSQLQNNAVNNQRMKLVMESYLDILEKSYKSGNSKSAERAFYISQLVQGKNVQNAVSSSAARASIKDIELINLVRQEQNATRKIEAGYNKLANNHDLSGDNKDLYTSVKTKIDNLVQARNAILTEIETRFPDYANLVRPKPVSVLSAKSVLAENEALIVTYSASEKLYVWTLLSDGRIHLTSKNINNNKLKNHVAKLRKGLDIQVTSLNQIPKFDTRLAYDLYNNTLRASAYLWRPKKTLTIISDGALSSLPFSVLVTEQVLDNKLSSELHFTEYRKIPWLAKKYSTSYSPAISTLVSLRQLKLQKKPVFQFAGFGNPIFSNNPVKVASSGTIKSRGVIKLSMRGLRKIKTSTSTNNSVAQVGSLDDNKVTTGNLSMLVPLPETEDEVLKVAASLNVENKGNVFLGNDANEHRVKNMTLNNRRVLMFATHALLPGDLDGLVQPAIALSNPKAAKGTGKNDGLLTMGEVMGLDLNADWVVLSACNTGAASGKGATAVSGLGQAFFYAGARSLLVSHWPVETRSAKEITTGLFAQQVENKTMNRADALNETIKDLIKNKTYKNESGKSLFSYAHPAFWAPFTVVGDGAGTLQ